MDLETLPVHGVGAGEASAAGPDRAARRLARQIALAIFFMFFSLYSLTGSKLRFGYEGLNRAQAEAIVGNVIQVREGGGIFPYTQGGLLDVMSYAPFAHAKIWMHKNKALPDFEPLIYIFVIPFYTTLILVVFFFLALELYRKPGVALALTLILALATQVWPYSKFGMETQLTFWTLTAAYALVRYGREPSRQWAASFGGACCLLMLTKITGLLHAGALGAAWLWMAWEGRLWRRKEFGLHAAYIFVLSAFGLALMLCSNHWRYGGWLWAGRYDLQVEAARLPWIDGIWAILFSWGKSIFIFNPPLLITLWFGFRFWRRHRDFRAILIVMIFMAVYHLNKRTWAEETWGTRRIHFVIPFLLLPLGLWLEELATLGRRVRRLGWAVIGLGVLIQITGILFDYTAMAKVAGFSETFSQDNTLWQPQFNHPRFNLGLLASYLHRMRTGQSLAFVYDRYYMSTTAPQKLPPPAVFSMAGCDEPDFWVLQPMDEEPDPDKPEWYRPGVQGIFYSLIAVTLLSGGWMMWRRRAIGEARIGAAHCDWEGNLADQ